MPSDPRRANALTVLAVVLALLLALVWLRSSGDAGPAVPAGLAVQAAPDRLPADETTLRPAGRGSERGTGGPGAVEPRRGRDQTPRAPSRARRSADHRRASDADPARKRVDADRHALRQDPAAAASGPEAGSEDDGTSGAAGASGGGASGDSAPEQAAPEFAIG